MPSSPDLKASLMRPFAVLLPFALLAACSTARIEPAPPIQVLAPPALLSMLPPAPAPGSEADKADVAALLALQASRTQATCDFAQADVEISLKRFLSPLGLTLNGDTVQTDALLQMLRQGMIDASNVTKDHYRRPRPYDYDKRLTPCISKVPATSFSYPSGHTAFGYTLAALLTQVVPEQQDKWYARAAEFARSRMVGGVHYPSDVDAGKIMGLLNAERVLRDSALRKQLELARPELRRALGY